MFSSLLITAALVVSQGGAVEPLKETWRREYPASAARLEKVAENFLAKGKFSSRSTSGSTRVANALTVASSGGRKLVVRDRVTVKSPKSPERSFKSTVLCRTGEYVFALTRAAPDEPYVIVEYADQSTPSPELDALFNELARSATAYRGQSLLSRMESESFVVNAIENVRGGNSALVRIDYSYENELGTEQGAIYLDPQRDWAIHKVDLTYKRRDADGPGSLKCDVDYDDVGHGIFFPTRVEYDVRFARPDLYIHGKLELSEVTLDNVPAESL